MTENPATEPVLTDRFDMPCYMREFLTEAAKHNVIDVVEMWALTINYRSDWRAMRADVLESAYIGRHVNWEGHRVLCSLNDAAYVVEMVGEG